MNFHLIPVIDLQSGLVVHARRGERAQYRPIESKLCRSCDVIEIVTALLDLFPFDSLYIADLDAILRNGDNLKSISAIRGKFPDLSLWIDAGIADQRSMKDWVARELGTPVVGSEVLDAASCTDLLSAPFEKILSLDFRGDQLIGPPLLIQDASLWPNNVIAMTMARIGSDQGPDFTCLNMILSRAGGRSIFAAGGVRDRADVETIIYHGATGVLLASALHDRRITQGDLFALASINREIANKEAVGSIAR